MKSANSRRRELQIPAQHNWRTTDAEEIRRRQLRAREESFRITNLDARHPIFSNFRVQSASGLTYSVEIRDLKQPQQACTCVDFRINGLGTCKHVEAVLLLLQRRQARRFRAAQQQESDRINVVPDPTAATLRLASASTNVPREVARLFDRQGRLRTADPEETVAELRQLAATTIPALRLSQEIEPWLEQRRRAGQRKELRREYELRVQRGDWPAQETKVPLFPYQREGMLHLAFTERALLADEMGLGKTIQAIAACALLHRLGQARHVLVVTPASLKTEWEDQINRFTELPFQLIFGGRAQRLRAYAQAPFFTIANYEQMVPDSLEVNERLRPDIVILDEAQRIKNWSTKTAQAIKRLRSRYAFVLTGTPIENRIDELHSLMDFLDPTVLGPLFRFNRDFYDLDERGRPVGYRQLDQLHARVKPFLLRRRKAEVETELPARTDRNHFVPLGESQQGPYLDHQQKAARLLNAALRRPLTKQEQEKLQRELAMMRMTCDTNYILDREDRTCPKLAELEKLLEECRENDAKVIVFSEWERMLELVRDLCNRLNLGYAWHTGSVPQKRRRAEINTFKTDPECRAFLSTDSGATGLNLQNASLVINCDLPWNPARLEQRIARAWRKHQTRPVTVINLITADTLEHRMLDTLATKQTVADSVLDFPGRVTEIKIRGSRQAFVARLQQLITPEHAAAPATPTPSTARPADPVLAFAHAVQEKINGALVRCEERYPAAGAHSVVLVVVDRDAENWRTRLAALHEEFFDRNSQDPLAPTQLTVIDRATDEAIQRLLDLGLMAKTDRAIRPLSTSDAHSLPRSLSPEEQARLDLLRTQAERKLKMTRLLAGGGLDDEARAAALDTVLLLGRALAVQQHLPEPSTQDEALRPPLAHQWQPHGPSLRAFVENPSSPCADLLPALQHWLGHLNTPPQTPTTQP